MLLVKNFRLHAWKSFTMFLHHQFCRAGRVMQVTKLLVGHRWHHKLAICTAAIQTTHCSRSLLYQIRQCSRSTPNTVAVVHWILHSDFADWLNLCLQRCTNAIFDDDDASWCMIHHNGRYKLREVNSD